MNVRYKIVGAMRLCDFHPSFGLAVAIRDGEAGYWLQVIAPGSERVQGFAPLGADDSIDVELLTERSISVGDDYVHAFLDRVGEVHLETAKDLQLQFRLALQHPRTSTPVKLAISEHMSDRDREREFRQDLAQEFAHAFGRGVGASYVNSAARSQLWGILEREAVSPEALERIRKYRSRFTAKVRADGAVEVDLGPLDPADLRIGFDEVTASLQGEFNHPLAPGATPLADLTSLPNSDQPTVVTVLTALGRSPRQEERVSILLRALVLYPNVTVQAIERYRDSAQMARNAVAFLRTFAWAEFRTERAREELVAKLVPRLVGDAYPRRRGYMLYYLAAHLSDFQIIADQIAQSLDKSAAYDVSIMRRRIDEALLKGRQRAHG